MKVIKESQAVVLLENDLESYNAWLKQNVVLDVIYRNELDSCSIICIVLDDAKGDIKAHQLLCTGVWNKIHFVKGISTLKSLTTKLHLALSERAESLKKWKCKGGTSNGNSTTCHSLKIKKLKCTKGKPDTGTTATETSEDHHSGQYDGPISTSSRHELPGTAIQDGTALPNTQSSLEVAPTFDLHHFRPFEVIAGFLNSYTCGLVGLKLVIPFFILVGLYLKEYVCCGHQGISIVQQLTCFFLLIYVTRLIVATTGQILVRGHNTVKLDMPMVKQLGSYMVGEFKLSHHHQCDPKTVISHCEKYLWNSFRDNIILVWSHSILLAIIFLQCSSHVNDMPYCKMVRVTVSAIVMGLARSCVVGYHYFVMLYIHAQNGKMVSNDTHVSTALSKELCWIKEKCHEWESFARLFTLILIAVTAGQIIPIISLSSVTLSYWKPAFLLAIVELTASCPCRSKKFFAIVCDVIALLHCLSNRIECSSDHSHSVSQDDYLELTEFHALVAVALLFIALPVYLSFRRSNTQCMMMKLIYKHQKFLYSVVIVLVLSFYIVCSHV